MFVMTLRKLFLSLAAMTMLASVGVGGGALPAGASTQDGTTAAISDDSPSAQITRLYEAFFLRTPPAEDRVFWVGELNSGARDLVGIADFFASGQEFDDTYGDLDDQAFVEQVYLNVQGRPGETEGVDFWTGELAAGNLTRGGVMVGFSEGAEFRDVLLERVDDSAIFRLYCAYFLRAPDAGGRTFWKSEFANGEDITAIADRFALVPEFEAAFGADTTDAEFVDTVYTNVLDRTRGADETFWLDQLESGAFSRGRVMIGFSEAPEYANRFTTDPPTECPINDGTAVPGDAPVAADDEATTGPETAVIVNVIANDTANEGTVTEASTPANGTTAVQADGSIEYTPNAGFTGEDTFTYTIANAAGSDTGTVTVTVAAGAPTANADSVDGSYSSLNPASAAATSTELSGLLDNDTLNGNVITAVGSPGDGTDGMTERNGLVSFAGSVVTYTAPADFVGTDSFTYTLGSGATASTATVTVEVAPQSIEEIDCTVFLDPPRIDDPATADVDETRNSFVLFLRSGGCYQPYAAMPGLDGGLTQVYADIELTPAGGTPVAQTPVASAAGIGFEFPIDPTDYAADVQLTLTGTLTLSDGSRDLMTNDLVGMWTPDAAGQWNGNGGNQGSPPGDNVVLLVDPFTGDAVPA